jgi:hypothetical protein
MSAELIDLSAARAGGLYEFRRRRAWAMPSKKEKGKSSEAPTFAFLLLPFALPPRGGG